jgi:hypothetical protein
MYIIDLVDKLRSDKLGIFQQNKSKNQNIDLENMNLSIRLR